MLRLLSVGTLVGALLLTPTVASAHHVKTTKFKAALNVGQEVPRPTGTKVGASGRFTATVTGTSLKFTLTFKSLTGPATQAHIHLGARGKAGNVIVPLCAPCKSPVSKTIKITSATLRAMNAGKTYANVHTAKNAGGEIRGQITRAS